jgi:uncharacterized protein YqeY
MGLKEKIAEDMKVAMKSGEKLRLETLRTLRAVLMEKEIEFRGTHKTMTPEEEIGVITGAAKKRRESIDLYEKGGRKDLADQEKAELAIIQEYLPRQLDVQEVESVIREIIASAGAAGAGDFGKVMPAVMKQLKGKADGKIVQETVKRILGVT